MVEFDSDWEWNELTEQNADTERGKWQENVIQQHRREGNNDVSAALWGMKKVQV